MNNLATFYKNLSLISGIIALIISILLLINHFQYSEFDPLETKAMKHLVEKFQENPENEILREEIRTLDLMSRKAYFTNVNQLRFGGILLLISSIIFVFSFRKYHNLDHKISIRKEKDEQEIKSQSFWRIIIAGLFIMVLAIVANFKSEDYFANYEASIQNNKNSQKPIIEVFKIENAVQDTFIENTQIPKIEEKDSTEIAKKIEASEQKSERKETKNTAKDTSKVIISKPNKVEQSHQKSSEANYPDLEDLKKQHNSFRGVFGNGISFATNIPSEWDETSGKNILWKTEIPLHGYNSPIVWDDKVFLTGADKERRVVYCFDLISGKILWEHEAKNITGSPEKAPKTTDDTGLAAPSIATDATKVCAIFGTGDVLCIDFEGNRIWAKNLGVPENHYGHSSSLLIWQEKLFVQYDTKKSGRVLALNIENGETIWDTERKTNISWASPVLAEINNELQLILTSAPLVGGYSAETGKELWALDCLMGEVGPSAAIANGIIYATNEYATLIAIDSKNNYSTLWEDDEYLSEVASPVVSNGLLFIATSYAVFACYDAKSGEKYWEAEFSDGFYSSPIIAENKVYILEMNGVMHIYEVSKEMKLISEPKLDAETTTTPAFVNGKILIRSNKHLYCIGNSAK